MKQCTKCKEIKELTQFYKNKVLPDGHACWCKKCQITYEKGYRRTPEGLASARKRRSKYREKNRERETDWQLKTQYGITLNDYERMFTQQNGVCAICKQPESTKYREKIRRLCVDHNHRTKEIRELICHRCNRGLGFFRDEIPLLEFAITYLKNHK